MMMRKNVFLQLLALLLVLVMSLTSCDLSFIGDLVGGGSAIGGEEGGEEGEEGGENPSEGENEADPEGDKKEEEEDEDENHPFESPALTGANLDLASIPEYSGDIYVVLNNNVPAFKKYQYTETSYEYYSALDSLGRCGVTVACIGVDLMPTGNRGSISSVFPSGWNKFVDSNGKESNFYERSHLIGFQLTGENANWQNLISGTYELNGAMVEFEEMVADYVKETENHVLYRVTPVFEGNNLLASGVHMEAYSIEDNGAGISFNVYIYNVQTDYVIDYATGKMSLSPDADVNNYSYVLNVKNKKIHLPTCSGVRDMSEANKEYTNKTISQLLAEGYSTCGSCKPQNN